MYCNICCNEHQMRIHVVRLRKAGALRREDPVPQELRRLQQQRATGALWGRVVLATAERLSPHQVWSVLAMGADDVFHDTSGPGGGEEG